MRWYNRMGRGAWWQEWRDTLRFRARPVRTAAELWDGDQVTDLALTRTAAK